MFWPELEQTLCDLEFIEAKCRAGMTYNLIRDFTMAQTAWPQYVDMQDIVARPLTDALERVRMFAHFVSLHAHIFVRDAAQVIPFAHNYATRGPVVESADRHLKGRGWRRYPWIELVDRPPLITKPTLLRTFEGHRGEVTDVAISTGRRIVVSGSKDGTIRVWDMDTGFTLRTIEAHSVNGINALAITPNGKLAASAGGDGLVCFWDLESGLCLGTMVGHSGEVFGVALTADGRYAVSGGEDGTVRVWDVINGQLQKILVGHFGPVSDVDICPDGRIAVSGSWDCSIRIWDINNEKTIGYLEGHTVRVQGVAISEDGTIVVSSSGLPALAGGMVRQPDASEVRFWTADGTCLFVGKGHSMGDRGGKLLGILGTIIYDIAMTPDARVAITGGYDRAVCVWDVKKRRLLSTLTGHLDSVLAVTIDHTGTLGVSGGMDRTVRLWQLMGESSLPMSTRQRIDKIGKGARTSVSDKAILLTRNQRIRKWILTPLLSVILGYYVGYPILVALNYPSGAAPLIQLAMGISSVWLLFHAVEWRMQLKADPHVWKSDVVPRFLRVALGLLLLPLWPFLRVLNCPSCGQRICGRRRLFHCVHCGWRDRLL